MNNWIVSGQLLYETLAVNSTNFLFVFFARIQSPIFVPMHKQNVFIITGKQGEGKTTKLLETLDILKSKKVDCFGFFAKGEWLDGLRVSFQIEDINTGQSILLCQDMAKEGFQKAGRFYFNPDAIRYGEKILIDSLGCSSAVVAVDEIGRFELAGNIWANSLKNLLNASHNQIILTIRDAFLDEVIDKFGINPLAVFDLSVSAAEIAQSILGCVQLKNN